MKKHLILTALAAVALTFTMPLTAQKKKSNVMDVAAAQIDDNSIIFPESFETDTRELIEGWYMKNYTATDNRYKTGTGTAYDDKIIMERLRNMPTVIEMPFNSIVRKYIDRYVKGKSLVTACLGLGTYYMPIIEQALEEEGLPNELKYLPMIESAYNPNAVSRAGATGMWQFMISAAKGYDMEVNSLIDERRDPYESSKKGAKLLKDLYNTYGRWDLAIAAYNCGPGNVNKALRRAGGDPKDHDFWSIYNYLPSETRGYFPMFVAANYIMNYYKDHGISPVVPTRALVTDTIGITNRVNLNQISKVLNLPMDELRLLNPQYRSDIIPGSNKKQYTLTLPAQQIHAYIMSEDDIINYNSKQYAQRVVAEPGQNAKPLEEEEPINEADYELAIVETPAVDAVEEDYREVREVSQKKEADSRQAKTDNADEATATYAATGTSRAESNTGDPTTHKVEAGETLESIARDNGVSIDNLKIWNGLSRNSVRVGQVLTVASPSSANKTNRKTQAAATVNQTASAASTAEATPATTAKPAQTATASRRTNAQSTASTKAKQDAASSKQSAKTDSQKAKTKQNTAQQTSTKSKNAQKADSKQSAANAKQTTKQKQQAAADTKQQASSSSKKSGKNNTAAAAETKNGKKTKQQAAKTKQAAQPSTHEVKKGESLERIAKQNGVSVDELKKANKSVKGDRIDPGDKLVIPSKSKGTTSKSKSGSTADSKKTNSKTGKSTKGADTKANASKSSSSKSGSSKSAKSSDTKSGSSKSGSSKTGSSKSTKAADSKSSSSSKSSSKSKKK